MKGNACASDQSQSGFEWLLRYCSKGTLGLRAPGLFIILYCWLGAVLEFLPDLPRTSNTKHISYKHPPHPSRRN